MCRRSNGRISLKLPLIAWFKQALEISEESGRAVGERVRSQAAQGEGFDLVQPAPDRGLDREQEVAAGEVDGFVGCLRAGDAGAAGAPVGAVDFGDRLIEDDQALQPRRVDGGEEPPSAASSASSHRSPLRM